MSLELEVDDVSTGVARGLGWGLEPDEGTFFHWGDNGAFKAFAIGSVQGRKTLVLFTNGASGLALVPEIVSTLMPGARPSLAWLDYGRHDAPARRMLSAARTRGAAAIRRDMENSGLYVEDKLWIVRGLIAAGRDEDGLWLRERIKPTRHPRSEPFSISTVPL